MSQPLSSVNNCLFVLDLVHDARLLIVILPKNESDVITGTRNIRIYPHFGFCTMLAVLAGQNENRSKCNPQNETSIVKSKIVNRTACRCNCIVQVMCRISSKPLQFTISANTAGLLPSHSHKPSGPPPCNDITFTSDLSQPLPASHEIDSESITNTETNHEMSSLPASNRVYQSVVVEPFHQPTISLIFRATPFCNELKRLPFVSLPSECSYGCHSYDPQPRVQEEKDDVTAPSCSSKHMSGNRNVYKTPPPSPGRGDRIVLLEPPPTPILHRTIVDFPHSENTSTPIDLFLPLILT